jgi:NitT/TauT family transport system substrate-binding protein
MNSRNKIGIKKIALYLFLLIFVGLLIWITFFRSSNSPELQKVTIAQTGDFFLYAPLYISLDGGFFEKNGLKVNIISTGGDDKTWAAVLSNNADFGIADPTFVAVSDERGVPGKAIANIVNGVPFWGITYDTTIKFINSPKDLGAYSVATFPSPSTAYTLQKKMFIDGHLKPNIKEGGFGTLIAMLKANQANIALELEPNVSQAVDDGAKIVYSLSTIYGDFAITGLTATPDKLSKNPELAQKVVCSIQQSLDYIHNHLDSALLLLEKRFPEIKKDVAESALRRVVDAGIIPHDAVISDSAWKKAILLRKDVGDLKNSKSMETYVDNSFAEFAKKNCSRN